MATPSSTPGNPAGLPKRTSSKSSYGLGLQKSDSVVSMDSRKSYDSISATGAHPLGSLRVHKVDEASPLKPLQEREREHVQDQDQDQDDIRAHSRSHSHESNTVDLDSMHMGGDVVLMLDLPEKFTVGYDSISFTAKHFAGLKEVPPGAHFFWASETDASSMRSGFWFVGGPRKDVHIVQWDKFNDVLCEPASQTEARIQLASLPSLYPKLPSYYSPASKEQGAASSDRQALDDLKETGLWPRLVSCVSERVLRRLTGQPTGPWHVHTTDRVKGTIVLPAERELENTVSVVAVNELTFSFTQTDRTYTADAVGAVRTEQAVDSTSHITAALNAPDAGTGTDADLALTEEDVVGELQFAFLAGMHLGNESCIHQWWHMVLRLVLRAYRLTLTKPRLARGLLEALTAQLRYDDSRLEGSVLEFGADHPRDLRLALTVYKRRLDETLLGLNDEATDDQVAVGRAFSQLEELAWRLGWDLRGDYVRAGRVMLEDGEQVEVEMDDLEAEDERGEFAPEVVEVDEHGRQKGLMSWD